MIKKMQPFIGTPKKHTSGGGSSAVAMPPMQSLGGKSNAAHKQLNDSGKHVPKTSNFEFLSQGNPMDNVNSSVKSHNHLAVLGQVK
jgi:hypothetical protein